MNPVAPRIEPWPVGIAAFFAVVDSLLASWAVVALRNREELVSPDYYEEELAYQGHIDRLRRSADSGVTIAHVPDGQDGILRIGWPTAARPVDGRGEVRLYRPSEAALDRRIPLAVGADGVQRIDASGLKPGLWRVRVRWGHGDSGFFVEAPVVIPPPTVR